MILLSQTGTDLLDILLDMETLLASDRRFLLYNWLNDAKEKATNGYERDLYEWNARAQITLWGQNYTTLVKYFLAKLFNNS
jgi:alpha-N-acetylglucosaminidase